MVYIMCNSRMDNAEVRRMALRRLIATTYGGVARQMALASGKPERQINDMLATPPRKSFGERVARQIENSLGLPPQSLDQPAEAAPDRREANGVAPASYRVAAPPDTLRHNVGEEMRIYGLASDEHEVLDGYRLADDSLKRTILLLARDASARFGRRKANHQ